MNSRRIPIILISYTPKDEIKLTEALHVEAERNSIDCNILPKIDFDLAIEKPEKEWWRGGNPRKKEKKRKK